MKPILCLLCLVLSSCAFSSGTRVPGVSFAPTNPDAVELLYQPPARPFVVIGFVTVSQTNTPASTSLSSEISRKFRESAATMGAQAVIVEGMPHVSFGVDGSGHGRAIRWK